MTTVPTELDAAVRGLAEVGTWLSDVTYKGVEPKAEELRAEIRRACKARGIRVRTVLSAHGRVWAYTWGPSLAEQCLPGEEPWRTVAREYRGSPLAAEVLREIVNRAWPPAFGEPRA